MGLPVMNKRAALDEAALGHLLLAHDECGQHLEDPGQGRACTSSSER
ncbi:MAG: hypothetical protein AAF690_18705 [Acidobacteriota bacterium]